jgi:hypothetical protein
LNLLKGFRRVGGGEPFFQKFPPPFCLYRKKKKVPLVFKKNNILDFFLPFYGGFLLNIPGGVIYKKKKALEIKKYWGVFSFGKCWVEATIVLLLWGGG